LDSTADEREAIGARLRELSPWHFDHEILPGMRTGSFNRSEYDSKDHENVILVGTHDVQKFFEKLYKNDLSGKSLLDLACNSGRYCFLAHELGAVRTLGVEVRKLWVEQAEFVKSIKYSTAKSVEFIQQDIQDYLFNSTDRFEISIFKGIFYHLPNPIGVLARVCDMTAETILVDTDSSDSIPEACLEPYRESMTQVMSGVDGLAWLPGGPAAIMPILEHHGFKFTEVGYWRRGATTGRSRGRFSVIASRSPIPT